MSESTVLQDLWDTGRELVQALSPRLVGPADFLFAGFWKPLASFRPSTAVQQSFLDRGNPDTFYFHKIESAVGPTVNLDIFTVNIDTLPSGYDGTALVQHIRTGMSTLFARSPTGLEPIVVTFEAYGKDDADNWSSQAPADALGALMNFGIGLPGVDDIVTDNASVLCTDISDTGWTFTTVHTEKAAGHPVSGNRRWSMNDEGDGTWVFTCAGVDRATNTADATLSALGGFLFAEIFTWLAMMVSVRDLIEKLGGKARLGHHLRLGPGWAAVKDDLFQPETDWVAGSSP